MNKTVMIFGLGQMGYAACYAMNKLGWEVIGVDKDLQKCLKVYNTGWVSTVISECKDLENILKFFSPQVVISCMPYHQNFDLAKCCIDNNLRYCDLGGNVEVSKRINTVAQNSATNAAVLTDLGLAPGLIGILGLRALDACGFKPDNVLLAVGGAGINDYLHFPTFYRCNWSVDGLINEYFDNCLVLEDGKIITKPGLSDLTELYDIGLCCFNTSGGAASVLDSMKSRGIENCSYKTIRIKEHYKFIRFLQKKLGMSKDDIKEFVGKACYNPNEEDLVKIYVKLSKGLTEYKYYETLFGFEDFSAMQRLTSFTLASVADLMGKGYYDSRKELWVEPYRLVNNTFYLFNTNMTELGLDFME